jgi:hypothetical protein
MKDNQNEYYFSVKTLFFATILFVSAFFGFTYLFISLYKEDLFIAVILSLPLFVFVIGLPDYLRFMYCAIIGKPALVLKTESLINNANGKVYNWSDIKSISYEQHTGFKAPPGGYILVKLKDLQSFRIPQNSIKCKTIGLLQDLQRYHKTSVRQGFDRKSKWRQFYKN